MRDIYQFVEIDVDYCGLDYGSAPCAAALGVTGDLKCYNTSKTCQDIDNFDLGVKTLRYGMSVSGVPVGFIAFPLLQSVSMRSSTVNISGYDTDMVGLGKRGTVSAKLKDAPHHDRGFDKYQSGRVDGSAQVNEGPYDPISRGTHFGKLRSRWPFYAGRPMRVVDAYLDGGTVNIVKTRHYIITDISGPDASGNVTIDGKDILDLADDKRTVVPIPVNGELLGDFGTDSAEFTLVPEGIGDVDYPLAGWGSFGSELIKFERVGDVFTVLERGVSGSKIGTAKNGDTFQPSFSVRKRRADLVIRDLLEIAKVDPAFIPVAEWTAEFDRWASGLYLTADITKPEGVNKLLGEIAQLGLSIWWDDVNQKVGLKVNRPPDEDIVYGMTDNTNIKAISQIDADDKRVTEVAFYSVPYDATKAGKSVPDYARGRYVVDQDVKGPLQFNDTKLRSIYSRWLNHGTASTVRVLARRIVNRFMFTPVEFKITIDADTAIGLTDVIKLESRINQDDTGRPVPRLMQCVGIKEKKVGHEIEITAQTYQFDQRYGYIAEDGRGSYNVSTDDEKSRGVYFVDETTLKFGDGTGPYVFI